MYIYILLMLYFDFGLYFLEIRVFEFVYMRGKYTSLRMFFFEVRTITLFDVSLNVIAIHCNTELEMLSHVRNISQIICIPWVPVSQLSPWNPAMQMQLCPPSTSSHVPPCWHGLLTHRLTSVTVDSFIDRRVYTGCGQTLHFFYKFYNFS